MINTSTHRSFGRYTWLFTLLLLVSGSTAANDGVDDHAPLFERVSRWLPGELNLSVSGGTRYEDNLIVDALDSVSRTSDIATLSSLNLSYKNDLTGFDRVKIGYNLEQRRFEKQSTFDLQTGYGFIDYSHNFGDIRIGTTVDMTIADLGGARLLESQQAGLYGSRMAMKKLYLRGGVGYKQTDFARALHRASESGRITVDGYYFIDGANKYIGVSYLFETEDAQLDRFDYNASSLTLRYSKRMPWSARRAVTLKADWRYQYREYVFPTPSISAPRKDHRHRWRIGLGTPITNAIDIELKYEHRDYASNLEALDLADNRFEARLTLTM